MGQPWAPFNTARYSNTGIQRDQKAGPYKCIFRGHALLRGTQPPYIASCAGGTNYEVPDLSLHTSCPMPQCWAWRHQNHYKYCGHIP